MIHWKRLNKDFEFFEEQNKYSYVKVWKTALSKRERKRRGIKLYIFSSRIGGDGKENKKYFDTRKEAEKHALKFMEFEKI